MLNLIFIIVLAASGCLMHGHAVYSFYDIRHTFGGGFTFQLQ